MPGRERGARCRELAAHDVCALQNLAGRALAQAVDGARGDKHARERDGERRIAVRNEGEISGPDEPGVFRVDARAGKFAGRDGSRLEVGVVQHEAYQLGPANPAALKGTTRQAPAIEAREHSRKGRSSGAATD